MMDSQELARAIVQALDSKKGKEIALLNTSELTTLADYFVLCTGTSNTQLKALTDAVEDSLSRLGEEPHHVEGHREGTWVLMDYSSVVVHIFTEEARNFYDLERLWNDAVPVDISSMLTT